MAGRTKKVVQKGRKAKEYIKNDLKTQVDYDVLKAQREGEASDPVGTPNNPCTRIFTVANVITFCRLLLTLAFLYLFVTHGNRAVALTCYVVAAVTDFLDGQVARRTQTVSWVGKIMDPIMDRVLLFTGVLGLVITGELPLWVAVFVIGRDAYLAVGTQVLQRYRRRPVDVIFIGKVATALLMSGFCDLLLGLPVVPGLGLVNVSWLPGLNGNAATLGIFLVYVGVICSTITACKYTREGLAIRKYAVENKSE